MAEKFDLVIIGMGSAGIVASKAAAAIGVKTAAIERDRVGGDCLWTGCVPSKTLLASAKVAHDMRTADRYGIPPFKPEIDTREVWRRIHDVQAEIATTDDDPARFRELGIDVIHGEAHVTGPRTVSVNGRTLETRFILVATGSRPKIPPIPGLDDVGYLTNLDIFFLERSPKSLVILGGGPIGVELAQGLNRLGVEVTLLEQLPRLLPQDEPELVDSLTQKLVDEGVNVQLEMRAERATQVDGLKHVHATRGGEEKTFAAAEILVATGRAAIVDGLGLEEVGVKFQTDGIEVDSGMRTSVKSIYAAGDVAGGFLFTHTAAREAVLAVRDMFFPGRSKRNELMPWATFTDPPLAHVGFTVAEARAEYGDRVEVRRADLSHSDRARTDGTSGKAVLVTVKDKLKGAHILAPAAGEIIHEFEFAILQDMKLSDLAMRLTHVYPTMTLATAMLAADSAYERVAKWSWLVRKTS